MECRHRPLPTLLLTAIPCDFRFVSTTIVPKKSSLNSIVPIFTRNHLLQKSSHNVLGWTRIKPKHVCKWVLKIIYNPWSIIKWSLILYKRTSILICDIKFFKEINNFFCYKQSHPLTNWCNLRYKLKYKNLVVSFISLTP